jgi:signal transduction histidine kinase/ActR/RegA family two-component response regulator
MIYRPDASASSAGAATEHLSAFLERVHPDDRARFDAALQRAAADGGFDLDYRLMGPDDSVRWINAKGQVATPERGQGQRIVGLSTDITDRRQLEEQFRQAQKMEAVGQLAGGIAHDFNNLLTVIKGNCEMLLVTEPTAACREAITEVLTASDRAAALTHQLLTFSRKQVMQLRPLDVNAVIRDLEPMLRRLIGEHIAVDTRLDPSLTMAMADQGQIEQILVNLAVNARDAMAGGGALRIETANLTVDAIHHGRGVDVPPGCYVVLSVADNGIGIARRIQPRLFEPFFTTKAAGKGTGLGLSTVYGIVKQSGGVVGVESEPGKGATFTAYLPCAPAAMLHATPREGPRAKEPGGTETILLAEDETALRRLVRQVLERQGYHVLESNDGAAALAIADAYQGRIDALVTDVVMPVMGGRELSERLRDRRPDVKVLFMSGYSNEDIAGIAMTHSLVTFLQKPFVPKALVVAIRDLLDAPMPRQKV